MSVILNLARRASLFRASFCSLASQDRTKLRNLVTELLNSVRSQQETGIAVYMESFKTLNQAFAKEANVILELQPLINRYLSDISQQIKASNLKELSALLSVIVKRHRFFKIDKEILQDIHLSVERRLAMHFDSSRETHQKELFSAQAAFQILESLLVLRKTTRFVEQLLATIEDGIKSGEDSSYDVYFSALALVSEYGQKSRSSWKEKVYFFLAERRELNKLPYSPAILLALSHYNVQASYPLVRTPAWLLDYLDELVADPSNQTLKAYSQVLSSILKIDQNLSTRETVVFQKYALHVELKINQLLQDEAVVAQTNLEPISEYSRIFNDVQIYLGFSSSPSAATSKRFQVFSKVYERIFTEKTSYSQQFNFLMTQSKFLLEGLSKELIEQHYPFLLRLSMHFLNRAQSFQAANREIISYIRFYEFVVALIVQGHGLDTLMQPIYHRLSEKFALYDMKKSHMRDYEICRLYSMAYLLHIPMNYIEDQFKLNIARKPSIAIETLTRKGLFPFLGDLVLETCKKSLERSMPNNQLWRCVVVSCRNEQTLAFWLSRWTVIQPLFNDKDCLTEVNNLLNNDIYDMNKYSLQIITEWAIAPNSPMLRTSFIERFLFILRFGDFENLFARGQQQLALKETFKLLCFISFIADDRKTFLKNDDNFHRAFKLLMYAQKSMLPIGMKSISNRVIASMTVSMLMKLFQPTGFEPFSKMQRFISRIFVSLEANNLLRHSKELRAAVCETLISQLQLPIYTDLTKIDTPTRIVHNLFGCEDHLSQRAAIAQILMTFDQIPKATENNPIAKTVKLIRKHLSEDNSVPSCLMTKQDYHRKIELDSEVIDQLLNQQLYIYDSKECVTNLAGLLQRVGQIIKKKPISTEKFKLIINSVIGFIIRQSQMNNQLPKAELQGIKKWLASQLLSELRNNSTMTNRLTSLQYLNTLNYDIEAQLANYASEVSKIKMQNLDFPQGWDLCEVLFEQGVVHPIVNVAVQQLLASEAMFRCLPYQCEYLPAIWLKNYLMLEGLCLLQNAKSEILKSNLKEIERRISKLISSVTAGAKKGQKTSPEVHSVFEQSLIQSILTGGKKHNAQTVQQLNSKINQQQQSLIRNTAAGYEVTSGSLTSTQKKDNISLLKDSKGDYFWCFPEDEFIGARLKGSASIQLNYIKTVVGKTIKPFKATLT